MGLQAVFLFCIWMETESVMDVHHSLAMEEVFKQTTLGKCFVKSKATFATQIIYIPI